MKIDYRELDTAILAGIGAGVTTFSALANRVEALAAPIAKRTKSPFPTPPWRIVDRRLQALRKLGIVEYRAREWHMASSPSAAHGEDTK